MRMNLNTRGIGALAFVTGMSVASVVVVATISQMGLDTFRRSAYSYSEWEANLMNQKALSLGGFLVAHNLVLCREAGWKDLSPEKKCRWGGGYHSNKIEYAKFDIASTTYDGDVLVLNVQSKDETSKRVDTKLRLDLVNWTTDPALRALMGRVKNENAVADDDSFLVMMTASTDLVIADKQPKTLTKGGALRRPIATPNILIKSNTGRESCIFECASGNVLNPFPECRGPLGAPASGGDAAIGVQVTNLGPGAAYQLTYERVTKYNPASYGTSQPDETTYVDIMGQDEVLMPGQPREASLTRKCHSPTISRSVQHVNQTTTGNPQLDNVYAQYGIDLNQFGNGWDNSIVTTGETTTSSVSVASSFRNLSSESFHIVTSKFDPAQLNEQGFLARFNPFDATTYRKNLSESKIEPRRLGTKLPTVNVGSPEEVITETTTVVRTRTIAFVQTDGDGGN